MQRVATVSYLNARPLVDGLDEESGTTTISAVPSELLELLTSGQADVALCPVIDFQYSPTPLEIVPTGAIGCDGPALTVKLFSTVPVERIDTIAVDGDSHTSVALLQVALHGLHGISPRIETIPRGAATPDAEALLLIGDKVITDAPDARVYRHQLDLGAAWHELAGTPFVFATWMTRAGSTLGDLPDRMTALRRRNRGRLTEIARRHAGAAGWPTELAETYLSEHLRYGIGHAELAGIEEFWRRCHELGVIDELRPMRLYRPKA